MTLVYECYRSGHVGKCCNLVLGCLKYMPQPVYTVRLGEEIGNRDIGNNEEIRNVKISASLPREIKDKYVNLLKHYKYVFT